MITIEGVVPSSLVIDAIARKHKVCLLAFSAGKDSILAWLRLCDRIKIIPFYEYLVPGLEFIEESLCYFERFFGQKILRLPHPSLYRMWNNMVFQPPERCRFIESSSLPMFEYSDLCRGLREQLKLPDGTMTASGVRAADSIMRRIHFKKHGPIIKSRQIFYPVWDWTIAELVEELAANGVKMPVDYWLFGRSFDGLDYRFLAPIRKHFPRDYARILEYFPLAELELKREEFSHEQN